MLSNILPRLGLGGLAVLFHASVASGLSQASFNVNLKPSTQLHPLSTEQYDAGLFTPFESLDALSERAYATLEHPLFPNYSVRLKQTRFCDSTVNSYTGYIDIEARHIFFYFFESRSKPDKDDVIFWANGGPGCSASLGLFMELGPCRLLNASGPVYHPESWNSKANIFFIDQPIGVGFSYADHGETVTNTEDAAKDIAAFMAIFFEHFSRFKGRGFHMASESYGGKYLPIFASAIYDQNAKLIEVGATPINLTSVMIGNGMTDAFKMMLAHYDMQCSGISVPPTLDIATCVAIKKVLPRCEKWMQKSCVDEFDAINCRAAYSFCANEIESPFETTGINPYDMTKKCEGGPEDICYPVTRHIRSYLSDSSVRAQLGVDPSVTGNFSSCSVEVWEAFARAGDILHPTADYVGALLERGVRVLIYVGLYDWACNSVGNERWTLALKWSGQEEFVKKELTDWIVDGKSAGKTRSAKGFTFATISGAGHMVPYDKPKESLEMVNRWLAGQEL